MTKSGTIFDIQRFSVQDGPGIRTLVFLKGCPLRCLWCCNPESQDINLTLLFNKQKCIGCKKCITACPIGAITVDSQGNIIDRDKCDLCGKCVEVCYSGALEMSGETKSVKSIMNEVLKDINIYRNSGGGVTLSGGEPIAQPKFATAILKECQSMGIHTAIETCGFGKWDFYEELLRYTDLVLFDIKHMDSTEHINITGRSNELILDNLKKITRLEKKVVARLPLIPGLNTSDDNINKLCIFLKENGIAEAHLLPYHKFGVNKYSYMGKDYELDDNLTLSDEVFENIRMKLESVGITVTTYNH